MADTSTGNYNTGKSNTGDYNTGNYNTGDYNTGCFNTGNYNTGDYNTGCFNTGNYNTGNYNTGDYNTGYFNTNDRNTGFCNAGLYNTGNYNTGDYNTGHYNTGDYNTGDYNTGYCNTVTPEDCLIFNKPGKRSDWINVSKPRWMLAGLIRWIDEKDMTDLEKKEHPEYKTTGGYLKAYPNLKEAYKEAWEKASAEDRAKTFKLPNFDIDVFEEIFGFRPEKPESVD